MVAGELNADRFIERLEPLGSPEQVEEARPYLQPGVKVQGDVDVSIGARMGDVFKLAKEFTDMPLDQVEVLLDSPVHEVRVGAVSIMDFQARSKRTPPERRKELFDLYIRRHDRINTWDLVDRSAPYVVGGYLFDKPRDILYELARPKRCVSAEPPSSPRTTSSGRTTPRRPSRSPRCWSATTTT